MKKKLYVLFLLVLMILPLSISAKETYISKYYVDATVLSNGDVRVKELFVLNGTYNGALKTLMSHNNSFTSSSIFEGSSLHNAKNIELVSIKEIPISSNTSFDDINAEGIEFVYDPNAVNGDINKYTYDSIENGYTYKMFNKSTGSEKGFYIEYIRKDNAVKHNDVAELWMNVLTKNPDRVKDFVMYIHLPNNESELRAWAHGPLVGDVSIIDKTTVKLTMPELYAGYSMDVRLAFDLNTIKDSTKVSNVDGLNGIIGIETKWADEANQKRDEAKEDEKDALKAKNICTTVEIVLASGLLILSFYAYVKYDKEHKSSFISQYYRDFPSDISPSQVGYLVRKSISGKELSASILYLIYLKRISFEEMPKNDYLLKVIDKTDMNEFELALINVIFGSQNEMKLSDLQKSARKNHTSFLTSYQKWLRIATKEAEKLNFYESHNGIKNIGIFYSILVLLLSLLFITQKVSIIVTILVMAIAVFAIMYFSRISRRTKDGANAYTMWMALKNFMVDFGRMDDKDLPQIVLWEKYLVYAVTLDCADKLAKTMKIKAQELSTNNQFIDNTYDYNGFTILITATNNIGNTVSAAVAEAYSSKSIADSTRSSGSGSDGGFSSGGGFSGGGGGSTGHF